MSTWMILRESASLMAQAILAGWAMTQEWPFNYLLGFTAVAEHKLVAIRLELWKELLRQVSAGALVRLVDQPHDPGAVVHADGCRRASPPVVERIAHCGKIGRANAGAWEGLVPLGGGELHDAVLHGENGITTGDLPLAISAVTGEAVAYLYGTDNAARRAEHYRSVVLNRAFMRAS